MQLGMLHEGKGQNELFGGISPSKLFTFEKVKLLLPEELHMRGCFQILTTHNIQYVIFCCATNCNSIIFDPSLQFFQSILQLFVSKSCCFYGCHQFLRTAGGKGSFILAGAEDVFFFLLEAVFKLTKFWNMGYMDPLANFHQSEVIHSLVIEMTHSIESDLQE